MPDPTPVAVQAVPTAAPVPPVAAATPPATVAPVVPSAAAPVAAEAAVAPVASAPAAAAPSADSLLPADAPVVPQTEAEKIAAARVLLKEADAAADPNSGKAWLLNEGVMGTGEKPGWFKADKYATVAKQAEAYVHLESRLGAFVGAPKDGKYEVKLPEGVDIKADSPLMVEFNKWAKESQLSQDGYSKLLNFLVQDVASRQPNMATIKGRLGDSADTRIAAVAQWGKANLGAEGYAILRQATSGVNAAEVFQVLEQVIAKTGQVRLPKPGEDVPGGQAAGLAAIKVDHAARDANGKLKVDTVPGYRQQIEKRYNEYYAVAGG